MIDQCQAEALQQMSMPGSGCIIFALGRVPMLDLACAGRDPVKLYCQLHVQHIQETQYCAQHKIR